MKVTIAYIITAVVVIALMIGWATHAVSEFEHDYNNRGGHTVAMYRTTVCLSPDGRIIDAT